MLFKETYHGIKPLAILCLVVLFFAGVTPVKAEQELKELKVLSCEASSTQTKGLLQGETNANAANVLDNNPATRWGSEFADNQWLIMQLNKKSSIKKIVIGWEIAIAKSYKVLISNDKQNWKEVFSTDNAPRGSAEITLDKAVKGKFIKLDLRTRATDWGFSIEDIRVMGY